MKTILLGVAFWGPYITLGELLALKVSWWPIPSISGTVWAIIKAYPPEAALIVLALIALGGHFDEHWSVWWFLGVLGLIGATLGVHLAFFK